MQNIFGIDVTEKWDDNIATPSEHFRIRSVSAATAQQLNEVGNTFTEFQEKAEIPGWLNLIQGILLICAVSVTCGILKAGTNQITAWRFVAFCVVFCLACWAGVFGISVYRKRRIKMVTSDAAFSKSSEKAEDVAKAAMQELRIPLDAPKVDVFSTRYKIKNGKVKYGNKHFSIANLDMFLFVEDENLCFADLFDVYAVPLDDILSMELQRKEMAFSSWNKEEEYNSQKYRPFKITCDDNGFYYTKVYEVKLKNDFMLLLPIYEQPTFSGMTGVFPDMS